MGNHLCGAAAAGWHAVKALAEQINELDGIEIYGRVVGVRGLMVEVAGPLYAMSVGARVIVETAAKNIPCEVVGFSGEHALLMPGAGHLGSRRGTADRRLARSCGQRAGRADRRQGAASARAFARSVPKP